MTVHVAVNEAILTRGTSGSARATEQVLAALADIDGVRLSHARPSSKRGRSRLRNAVADAHWDLRGAARVAPDADVLISPCNIGAASHGQKHILVVYDVMVWESSQLFDPSFAAYARRLIPFSMRRADRVLTLSSHAKGFLLEIVPSADIHVLTLPGRPCRVAQAAWSYGPPTVLMIGETAPHKNQVAGIEAVHRLRETCVADVRLRIIGPPGRAELDVVEALAVADPTGTWATRETALTDSEVDSAYASAWVLLQPSHNEGYGLPLVEAAQHGPPVVHSGAGGMRDVLPDSSIDSKDPLVIERRLRELLVRSTWEQASADILGQAHRFAWRTFRSTIEAHLHALSA